MILSASALLLTALASPASADITPASLAVRPPRVDLGDAAYDWALQQRRFERGSKLADTTANCNTQRTSTHINGQSDSVPD